MTDDNDFDFFKMRKAGKTEPARGIWTEG